MSRSKLLICLAVAVGLVLWAGFARETWPLVVLAAAALVTALVQLGPSDARPDPRDPQDAAEQLARRRRHAEGHLF